MAEAGHNQFVETCQAAVASQQKAWDKMLAEEDASKAPVRERSGPLASIMLHMNAAELGTAWQLLSPVGCSRPCIRPTLPFLLPGPATAKQLTLFDASLFRRILPVEYLNHLGKNEGWGRRRRECVRVFDCECSCAEFPRASPLASSHDRTNTQAPRTARASAGTWTA